MKVTGPPRFALAFFRWFCHPAYLEEIEGDLLEQFHKHSNLRDPQKARLLFIRDVFFLFRPRIIFNFSQINVVNTSSTQRIQWAKLLFFNMIFILVNLIPFFPGPYTGVSIGLSMVGRTAGFFGLLLFPVGLCWLIIEIWKLRKPHLNKNSWTNGYYFAIISTCISIIIYLLPSILASIYDTIWAGILFSFSLVIYLRLIIPKIRKLKKTDSTKFNLAPLYLLTIPAIALVTNLYLVEPVSDYSRNHAIANSQNIISAIEDYKLQRGYYPNSLDELSGTFLQTIPGPSVMGIDKYEYQKAAGAYNLSFVQWVHFGATQEIVMYNKNDEHDFKGHFASFNANEKHWKYFWLD